MPAIECPSRVICDCTDNPFANLSAEGIDKDRFFSVLHFQDQPKLGTVWSQLSCVTVCHSEISQEDADLCALRQAQQCVWDSPGFGGDWRLPPTILHPNGQQRQIYSNAEQVCSATCPDGSFFIIAVPAGSLLGLTQEQADFNAYNYACKKSSVLRICLTIGSSFCCQNTFFETTVAATGAGLGTANTWSIVAGALPPGLTFYGGDLEASHAAINGTPTTIGDYSFTVRVESPHGETQTKTFSISVGGITTASTLPDADTSTAYSQQLAASGMTAPLTWSLLVGLLPEGLTLDSATGIISGTATEDGTFAFTIQVSDSSA